MKRKLHLRKTLALVLSWLMLFTSLPLSGISFELPSFASAVVGQTKDGLDITVTRIEFIRKHNGFTPSGGYLQIYGTNLVGLDIMVKRSDGQVITPGQPLASDPLKIPYGVREADKPGFLKFNFESAQMADLMDVVIINGNLMELSSGGFPSFGKINKTNFFFKTPSDMVLEGNNLNLIGTSGITASYGVSKQNAIPAGSPTSITINNPQPPDVAQLGFQNLKIEKSDNALAVPGGTVAVQLSNLYANAFRFLDDIGLNNLQMYPNTGAKGEQVYIDATGFTGVTNFAVFFLKALDPKDDYSDVNKSSATSVVLDPSVSGKGQIIATVPTHADFGLGDYNVYIARLDASGNVVASQRVNNTDGTPSIFTVVQSSSLKPSISEIAPVSGPDSGSDVTVRGKYIIYPEMVGLNTVGGTGEDVSLSADQKTLHVDYKGSYSYKLSDSATPAAVTMTRDITVTIGKRAFFRTTTPGNLPDVTKGTSASPDTLNLHTDVVSTLGKVDVLVDVVTRLTTTDGSGKVYVFHQAATALNGYEFYAGTMTPSIKKVNPPKFSVDGPSVSSDADYELRNQTYMSIEGGNFMVQQYEGVDPVTKKPNVRYPSVLIKTNRDDTDFNKYQWGFFPNKDHTNGLQGVIYKTEKGEIKNLASSVDITVFNAAGDVVTGIPGNDVGTRMLIKVPKGVRIGSLGLKHVQVVNPIKDRAEFGGTAIKNDAVEFVNPAEAPVVTGVEPSILTTDGGQDVKVLGRNLRSTTKLYLDGNEISSTTLTDDTQINFKSPKGREGVTQLLILNEDGGTTVWPITYVKVLQNAPTITNFAPTKGTVGTLVVVNGTNFQKPDPTVAGTTAVDMNRLIGTRVLFDGKDVNDYNKDAQSNILLAPYTSPTSESLIQNKDGLGYSEYSAFKDNALVTMGGKPVVLGYDSAGRPTLIDSDGNSYVIKYEGTGFKAYDRLNNLLGDVTISPTQIDIGAPASKTFSVTMDNNILSVGRSEAGGAMARTADYANAVLLKNTANNSYATVTTDLGGNVILSNGKEDIFTITYDGGFKALKVGGVTPVEVTVTQNGLTVGSGASQLSYSFVTPYVVDSAHNNLIAGYRTKVVTKNQIIFTIPKDRGYLDNTYYDLTVANPDTKSDSKTGTNGFYLSKLLLNPPVISSINPDKGSTEGGYLIQITGNYFDNKASVYIDSVLVPATDTVVAADGKSISVKVPKCTKDLQKDFKVDRLTVPVVVVNGSGNMAYREKGFTYIKAASSPVITVVPPLTGSSNGGQIVEIQGEDLRFYEPYQDINSNGKFDASVDKLTDLNGNGIWDMLLPSAIKMGALKVQDASIPTFGYYLKSPILPRIYFGDAEAKIVDYGDGYLKVIAPPHAKGAVDLFLVNNDYGVSNKVVYTYVSSSPKITSMVPNNGRRTGQEVKDIYGTDFFKTTIRGYYNPRGTLAADADSKIVTIPEKDGTEMGVNALVRFANIDNLSVSPPAANSGQINNKNATVQLEGGLTVNYHIPTTTEGALDLPEVTLKVTESGKEYSRTFKNYDDTPVFLPMEMLQSADGKFYTPFNYTEADGSTYQNNVYEYIKISVVNRSLKVERGYAPKAAYDNSGHIMVKTASYYSIDTVSATVYNSDGGTASTPFTYTNPASTPKIYQVKDYKLSPDGSYLMVEGAINATNKILILGQDLRKDATVSINGKPCKVIEQNIAAPYDSLLVEVPTGATADIDQKYPVVVRNTDGGLASSATDNNLIPDNYTKPDGTKATMKFFFIYRKALSGPKITAVSPEATSVYGGNTVTITGSDFRTGATILIGAMGGVPVTPSSVDPKGTSITFVTPKNLPLGKKDIQVINPDFGTDTKTGALTIVSYPQTTYMYDEDHRPVGRLSTEGGQTITIVGSGFQKGARVIFGGTSAVTGDPIGGNVGLWKNDTHYLFKNGVEGTEVTVLDSTALTVKTPAIKTEGPVAITVLNPDSGVSDGNLITESRLPIPSDITMLSVKVVDKKYIELYNYTSKNLDYYEIYYYIGQENEQTLRGRNNYQDFKLLEVTDREPYKVLELPGFDERKSKDTIWFVVKAVNKYGASNYSNLAYLSPDDIKELSRVGAPDLDGPVGVPKGREYQAYVKDNALSADLSDSTGNVSMTLTSYGPAKYPLRQINLPAGRVLGDYGTVQVDYGDTLIRIAPVALNTGEFNTLNQSGKAYGQISTSTLNNSYTSTIKSAVPRNQRIVSPAYQIGFAALNNKGKSDISRINSPMLLQFDYGRYPLTAAQESKLGVYKYNTSADQWQKITGSQNKKLDQLSIQIREPGVYMMLTTR